MAHVWAHPTRALLGLLVVAALLATTVVMLSQVWGRSADASEAGPPRAGARDHQYPTHPWALSNSKPRPARLLTAAQTSPLLSTAWQFVGLRHHDRAVDIWSVVGPSRCSVPGGIYVRESSRRVLVGTYARRVSGVACADDLRMGFTRVHLQHPLGGRTLLHTVVTDEPGYGADAFDMG